jgi:tetratricopeptide (TPR) repeat protein
VDTLGVTVLDRDQRALQSQPAASLEAYQQYLEGRFLLHNRFKLGRAATEQAIGLFERALELDPQFAEAWGAKASALATLNSGTVGSRENPFDPAELTARTFAAAERAIALNPRLAEPYAARAQAYMQQLDWIAAERQVQMAIEREPRHADTLVRHGILLVSVGRSRQALEVLQTASRLDPVNAATAHWLADALRNTGQLQKSKAEAERSLQLGMLTSGIGIYAYYVLQKDWSGATDYLMENMRAQNVDPSFAPVLIEAVRDRGKTPAALAALEATANKSPQFDRLLYAFLYDLEDPDPLFDAIEATIDRGGGMYAFWRIWEPQFTRLRNHPRFRDIAERTGLVAYWRTFGWPDQCRPDKDSFVCN